MANRKPLRERASVNQCQCYLPDPLYQEINHYARQIGMTRSEILREAAKYYLATHADQVTLTL